MDRLNPSTDHPSDWAASSCTRSGRSGVVLAGGWHAEGGAESGEAAGLVLFKTSPEQTSTNPEPHREGDTYSVSFDDVTRKIKRLKRLKSSVWLSGQLHGLQKHGYRPEQPWFITLTYRDGIAWHPDHISQATDRYRAWCKRRNIVAKYIWVAEIQPSRAERTGHHSVHYHLIAWLPHAIRMTFWDKPRRVKGKRTSAFWTHGSSETEKARQGVSYLMKYVSKMGEFHDFPHGLRLYGVGGLDREARSIRQWRGLPAWVRATHGVGDIKRMGSHMVNLATGELLEPMFRRKFVPGGVELVALRDMPQKIYDYGAFSTYPRPSP